MAGKTKYFNYDPSVVAAAVATALFGITTIVHLWQMCRRRTWYFTAFVVGGFCKCLLGNSSIASTIPLTQTESRGFRLWNAHHQRYTKPRLHQGPVHCPNPLDPPGPSPLRCVHLHDPQSAHPPDGGRASVIHQINLVDQDFRSGRRALLLGTGRRYVSILKSVLPLG